MSSRPPSDRGLCWARGVLRPASEFRPHVTDRAFRYGDGVFTTIAFRDGRLRVLRARVVDGGDLSAGVVAAGEGALELLEVQPEGKRPMPASAWLAGARPAPGERLG